MHFNGVQAEAPPNTHWVRRFFILSYLHHLCTDFCSGCKGSSFSTLGPAFVVLLFIEPNELESQTEIGGKRKGNLYKPVNLGERGRDQASVTAVANRNK